MPEDRPALREWFVLEDVSRWRRALLEEARVMDDVADQAILTPTQVALARLVECELHLPGLTGEDLPRIIPKALAAFQVGWRNVHFEVRLSERRMTLRAELGGRISCVEELGLGPEQSVADGAVILLDLLAIPMPGSFVDFVDPPLTREQWDRLGCITPNTVIRQPVIFPDWLGPEPGGLTMDHFWRAREAMERNRQCCGQPMVECDFGNALKCETCQRVVRRRLHGQHSPQGWVDRRTPDEALADYLPQDGDPGLRDRIQTLLDLARAGQEADFKFLAGAVGVPVGDLEALWAGTVARLKRDG